MGCLITRGNASAVASARNVLLSVWDSAHGQGDLHFSKSQYKQLLKTAAGSAIKYSKLIKWSRSKAAKKGLKAEKKYLAKHFEKYIKPI